MRSRGDSFRLLRRVKVSPLDLNIQLVNRSINTITYNKKSNNETDQSDHGGRHRCHLLHLMPMPR